MDANSMTSLAIAPRPAPGVQPVQAVAILEHKGSQMGAADDPHQRLQVALRERKTRRAQELQRAKTLNAPSRDPVFTQEVERDLKSMGRLEKIAQAAREKADEAWKHGRSKEHRAAVASHKTALDQLRVLRRRVHRARGEQVDARWADGAVAETSNLALLRGEALTEEDTAVSDWLRDPETGAMVANDDGLPVLKVERSRARRRENTTGLARAFEKGDMDDQRRPNAKPSAEALYDVGKLYRTAYLVANSLLTPTKNEIRSALPSGPQFGAVAMTNELATMRKGLTPKQLIVLDGVCGEDIAVGTLAKQAGIGVPAVRRALRGGLIRAQENREERDAAAKRAADKA